MVENNHSAPISGSNTNFLIILNKYRLCVVIYRVICFSAININEEAEIINGSYSDFARLILDGEEFRSNSKTVVLQVKKLLELEMIPVKVCVAEMVGKSGREYHTLRGKST